MRRLIASIAVLMGAVAALPAGPAQAPRAAASVRELVEQAFDASYNLDHAEAKAIARRAVAEAPDDPAAHRALASALWVEILFKRGAMTIDSYVGGVAKLQASLPKPPPDLEKEFHREMGLAISLAEARVDRNKRDVQAWYDAGAAYALQASYVASVEGSLMSAFNTARRAYDAQERVLESDPSRYRASVVVGTYRYIVSGLSFPKRLFAYIVGFGGGKERGIQMIESAAVHPDARVDAMIALVLIYTREKRNADALVQIRALQREFPRNRLLVLEEGSALLRIGRAAEAEAVLSRGWTRLEQDARERSRGEESLWLYKRGAAHLALKDLDAARVDLNRALASRPVEWVRGRLHLELGKLADLAGRRPDALAAYRLAKDIADAVKDEAGASEANRLLRRPYAGGSPDQAVQ